jgi:competence protein ComEA
VARTTTRRAGGAEDAVVPDIVVESSLRQRIDDLFGNRRDLWIAVAAVAAIVVVALALLGRGAPARIAPPAQASAGVTAPAIASPTAVVYVDVAGAVRSPGLYSLPAGARVADALAVAGGTRARADLSTLNLAEILLDGTKVDVPGAHRVAMGAEPAPPATPSTPTVVLLNSADQAALETIPGVGPVTAGAILAYRGQIGSFESIDQLLDVDGIGPATLEAIRPYVGL